MSNQEDVVAVPRTNGAWSISISLAAAIQIVVVLAAFGGWLITYVSSSVSKEETARIAEVNGQSIQRTADMDRLKQEVNGLAGRIDKITDEGTAHSNQQLAALASDLRSAQKDIATLREEMTKHEAQIGHSGVLESLQKLQAEVDVESARRDGADAANRVGIDDARKHLDREMEWNEDQERRLIELVQRITRLESGPCSNGRSGGSNGK